MTIFGSPSKNIIPGSFYSNTTLIRRKEFEVHIHSFFIDSYDSEILTITVPSVSSAYLCPALAEHSVFVVSVRNGSQLTGVPWDLRLAGHTSATHTFLVVNAILPRQEKCFFSKKIFMLKYCPEHGM